MVISALIMPYVSRLTCTIHQTSVFAVQRLEEHPVVIRSDECVFGFLQYVMQSLWVCNQQNILLLFQGQFQHSYPQASLEPYIERPFCSENVSVFRKELCGRTNNSENNEIHFMTAGLQRFHACSPPFGDSAKIHVL